MITTAQSQTTEISTVDALWVLIQKIPHEGNIRLIRISYEQYS